MALAAAAFLADTLLLSAAYKCLNWGTFDEALHSYRWLVRLPRFWLRVIGPAVVLCELLCVVALLVHRTTLVGGALSAALFGGFYLLVAQDGRSVIVNCGCWGNAGTPVPRIGYVVRNAVLLCCGAVLTILAATQVRPLNVSPGTQALALGLAAPFALLILEAPTMAAVASVARVRKAV